MILIETILLWRYETYRLSSPLTLLEVPRKCNLPIVDGFSQGIFYHNLRLGLSRLIDALIQLTLNNHYCGASIISVFKALLLHLSIAPTTIYQEFVRWS